MGQLIWIEKGWGVMHTTGVSHYFEDTSNDWPLTLCGFTTDSDIFDPAAKSSDGFIERAKRCKRCESAVKRLQL